MKKIVIATDSFKECMSGIEVAKHIKKGFSEIYNECEYHLFEIADGGEGTTKALVNSTNGSIHKFDCINSLDEEIISSIGFDQTKTIAYIEVAQSAGIELINSSKRNPLVTSTKGVGCLIKESLKFNVKKIIVGLGSSITNDLGVGMLQELGIRFFDSNDSLIEATAANLSEIKSMNTDEMIDLSKVEILVACDVDNPLYGKNGATAVYSQQKGATPQMQKILETGIINLANVMYEHYHIDPQNIIGGGAAGGLGAAFAICLNASLKSGIEIVAELLNLEEVISTADLVITGEGRMEGQSINGKGPIGIALMAKKYQVPCIAICGSLGNDINKVYDYGISACYSTMMQAEELTAAIKHTPRNLELTASTIARTTNINL